MRVTGAVLQPSDRRVKQDIVPVDTEAQLRNIQALGLYSYTLKPEWTASVGIADAPAQCGVLAQDRPAGGGATAAVWDPKEESTLVVHPDHPMALKL